MRCSRSDNISYTTVGTLPKASGNVKQEQPSQPPPPTAMPWLRPHRILCFLCVASCESVVSSFGVYSVISAAATNVNTNSNNNDRAVNLVRGGAASPSSSSRSSNGIGMGMGMSNGGAHDNSGGGGRKGVSAVQAVAEGQRIAVPAGLGTELAQKEEQGDGQQEEEQRLPSSEPPPQQQKPSGPLHSIEEGERERGTDRRRWR